jgi:hypothetical protein
MLGVRIDISPIEINIINLYQASELADRLCGLVVRSRGPGFDSRAYQIF